MFTSFYTGISGLNANATALNVVGNNLANINTIGFKTDIISFQDVLSANTVGIAMNGNPIQIGLGTKVAGVSGNFNQGSLKSTNLPTDMAIVGSGFFLLQNGTATLYSRAGNFTMNAAGQLTSQQGYPVLGWNATDGVLNTNTAPAPIVIAIGQSRPARATDSVRLDMNLNSQTATGGTYTTSARVYDSLGTSHTLTYTFTRTATGWDYAISCPTATVSTGATGSLTFDNTGRLTSPAAPGTVSIGLTALSSGAADLTFNWNTYAGTPAAPVITQYSSPSTTSQTYVTGYPPGSLTTFGVDPSGVIQGIFDNGQVQVLGQLALATFANPQGLVKNGQNTYSASLVSGDATIGVPGAGGRGDIASSNLELSNVDLATEFTNLIISQRGYQASSKVITTTDEVSQEAINLKR